MGADNVDWMLTISINEVAYTNICSYSVNPCDHKDIVAGPNVFVCCTGSCVVYVPKPYYRHE